jgi:eukaryotic-like serine/threonine-protein kinase
MPCLDATELLDLAEGAASPSAVAQAELHLDQCSDCRWALSSLLHAPPPAGAAERPEAATQTEGALVEGELPALAPGAKLGRYVILERVGAGAMVVVYSA